MAVPDLSRATAASLLFTRLPVRLFSPLASENRQRYWALLCRLHERRFGPEAPLPPSRGFPTKVIIQDIAEALELMDAWDDEESCISETPTEVRAAWIFNRLYECGWIRIEQPRFDRKVTMQPAVSQFLTLLVSFAETGPVFVAGKIRSIDANVQLAASGQPESLGEAAEQSRNLLEHIRNTGTNIREFMDSLQQNVTTAQYVQKFFNEYIERVFIGDYRELRTKEHPLSKRGQILEKVEEIQESEEMRNKLIAWYEAKRCQGDRKKAERMFERDIQRLIDFAQENLAPDRVSMPINEASGKLFKDTKRIKKLAAPIDVLLAGSIDAESREPSEVWAEIKLFREEHPVRMAGNIIVERDQVTARLDVPYSALPADSIRRLIGTPSLVLTIENQTTFHSEARRRCNDNVLLIFTSGMPNPPWRAMYLRILKELPPEIPVFHWGDIDEGGFRIASVLAKDAMKCGHIIKPWPAMRPDNVPIELRSDASKKTIGRMVQFAESAGWGDLAVVIAEAGFTVEQESLA